jgi:glycosyltransferase involved in cell wall biosynthesis
MTPVRVLAFHTVYPHWGQHAGAHQVCRYFDPARVAVSIRPVSDSDADWPLLPGRLSIALRNRVSRRLAWYKLSDLAAELRALPDTLGNAVDVVHYLDGEHTAQFLPRWVKRWPTSRVRTVATFHQPPELLPDLVSPDIVRHLDFVLVVSPTQEPFFREFLPAHRVRTLLYGVDADFFRPSASRSPDGVFRCITAGHWMRDWRAVRSVAEALSAHRDIEFHVVTGRPTPLEDLANVTIHRDVSDESLLHLYQQADVLFLPLVSSTANNSLLEGLACGLPVVSTRLASVSAYVGEGPAVLVAMNDPAMLGDALLALRRDPARRAAMAQAARRRAEALAWSRVACEWERTYRDILGRPSTA